MDYSTPSSPVHGISQGSILEWVAIHCLLRRSSGPQEWTLVSCIGRRILYHWAWEAPLINIAAAAKSFQSCPTLCDPKDGSPPGSAAPGILQARTLEWVAISFSNAWKWKVKVKSLQSCPTLCDPMDCSPPGSSVHGIFQARVLEWVATDFDKSKIILWLPW